MGLDMYLHKRTYVKRWDHIPPDKQYLVIVTRGGEAVPEIDPERVSEVVEQVGYWRKANAIHKWFVDNIQGGVDDCRDAYVERDQLALLLDTVNRVLADHDLAEELLPPQSGFFFGDTEVDAYYWRDLEDTKKIIEEVLAMPGLEGEFYYHSSW
jgi:hypothetical protein